MENYLIVSPEHATVHERLIEWARWGRTHWRPHTCRSLEGNYRPPPAWEAPTPRFMPHLKQIYEIEYLIVNAPKGYGIHLIAWYVKKLPPTAIKKKLKIRPDMIVSHLFDSREYIKRMLK